MPAGRPPKPGIASFHVKLPAELVERLDSRAADEKRPRSELLADGAELYLKRAVEAPEAGGEAMKMVDQAPGWLLAFVLILLLALILVLPPLLLGRRIGFETSLDVGPTLICVGVILSYLLRRPRSPNDDSMSIGLWQLCRMCAAMALGVIAITAIVGWLISARAAGIVLGIGALGVVVVFVYGILFD